MRQPYLLRVLLRIALALLLLLITGFGLVKGYYWYQVRSVVEDFARQLSLVAELQYGSIETGFDGVAGVRDLRVIPLGQKQGLSIDAVRIKASGWRQWMALKSDLDRGRLPQALGIEIDGLVVDLSGPMIEQLTSHPLMAQTGVQNQAASWMPGCEAAGAGLTDLQLMQRLGYQQLVLHLSADYRFDRSSKLLQLEVRQSMDNAFGVGLSLVLDLGINEFNRNNLAFAKPSLGSISLDYQDRSYNKRLIDFCAKPAGETAEQFVDRHIGLEVESGRELGLVLPESLSAAYRDFLLGVGDVRLTLLEGLQLDLTALPQYSPDQLLQLLAPELTVNGNKVEPLSMSWQPPQELVQPLEEQMRDSVAAFTTLLQAPFAEPEPEPEVAVVTVSPAPASNVQPSGYRQTRLDRLQSYVGSHIRIETKNGFRVEGRLLSVKKRELRIYQEVGTGDAILPIPFKHIELVRVYR